MPQIKTEQLRTALSLCRPAVDTQKIIKELGCFLITPTGILAYNDRIAISVAGDFGIHALVEGDAFFKLCSTLPTDEVQVTVRGPDVRIKSGDVSARFSSLPVENFPYTAASTSAASWSFDVTAEFLEGIERCLLTTSDSPQRPQLMGVTMYRKDDGAVYLCSANNSSMTQVKLSATTGFSKKSANAVLPATFCEQLLQLSKAFEGEKTTVFFLTGAVLAMFGDKAVLFAKQPYDKVTIDLVSKLREVSPAGLEESWCDIPLLLETCLDRSMIVVGGLKPPSITLSVQQDHLDVLAEAPSVQYRDVLKFKGGDPGVSLQVNPALLGKVSGFARKIHLSENYVHLWDEGRWRVVVTTQKDSATAAD